MSGLRDRLLRMRGSAALRDELRAGMPDPVEEHSPDNGIHNEQRHSGEQTEVLPEVFTPPAEQGGGEMIEELPLEWAGLGVQLMQNSEGAFLLREVRYPAAHRHGLHGLDELQQAACGLSHFRKPEDRPIKRSQRSRLLSSAAAAINSENKASAAIDPPGIFQPVIIEPDKVLFLDLETTGLGVGTGNVPFMVGLAFSKDGLFFVEQMLIRHPAEERAMIAYLSEKLPDYTHLVTYNGRTFDWPVLHNRFILNGFRHFTWEPTHIDLLHPSRSVWRNTLTSCKLSHVEEERLGITRTDDVPGSLAPALYFQYLADGRPEPLLGVFLHNETDMLSLACLAIRFGHILNGELGSTVALPVEHEEQLRTGLWLEKMGQTQYAEQLFIQLAEDENVSVKCLCLLAERDKKCGNWTRAVVLWQKAVYAARHSDWPDWEAHIELAMYYEHKTKQLEEALTLAETSLALAQRRYSGLRLDAKRRSELEAIRKRMDRLRSKIRRHYG
ncbi:ribonuclease H-like domain-containing protein [Paenibacillus solisilvae]|uniref:Ribonuclease H-like domain-containing protein n=1 Tax=Paenibacillus solisilvae TaxID=2486751 RepID=A0ABW0VR92_9BACL